MANRTKVTAQKDGVPETEGPGSVPDSPLLDLADGAVRKLIRSAKKRGYVTNEQINAVLPSDEANSEQIENLLSMFNDMGVNVVENEEAEFERGRRPGGGARGGAGERQRAGPDPAEAAGQDRRQVARRPHR